MSVPKCHQQIRIKKVRLVSPWQRTFFETFAAFRNQGQANGSKVGSGEFEYSIKEICELYRAIFTHKSKGLEGSLKIANRHFLYAFAPSPGAQKNVHVFDITYLQILTNNLESIYLSNPLSYNRDLNQQKMLVQQIWEKFKLGNVEFCFDIDSLNLNLLLKVFQIDEASFAAVKTVNVTKALLQGRQTYHKAVRELSKEGELLLKINPDGDLPGIQLPPIAILQEPCCYINPLYDSDLFDFLEKRLPFPFEERLLACFEILCGFYYLNELGYIYLDFKPENILVMTKGEELHLHLADFGEIGTEKAVLSQLNYPLEGIAYSPNYVNVLDIKEVYRQFKNMQVYDSAEKKQQKEIVYIDAVRKMSSFCMAVNIYILLTNNMPRCRNPLPYTFDSQYNCAAPHEHLNLNDLEKVPATPVIKALLAKIFKSDLQERPTPRNATEILLDEILQHPLMGKEKQNLLSMRECVVRKAAQASPRRRNTL